MKVRSRNRQLAQISTLVPTFMSQLRMIDREEQELTLASELTA
jgi:hypothetical protein